MLIEDVVIFAVSDDDKGKYVDYQENEKRAYRYYIPYKFISLIIYQVIIIKEFHRHTNYLNHLNIYKKEEFDKFKSKSKRYYICINVFFWIYYIFYFINFIFLRAHYIKFYSKNNNIKNIKDAKDDIKDNTTNKISNKKKDFNKNNDINNNSTNIEVNIDNSKINLSRNLTNNEEK